MMTSNNNDKKANGKQSQEEKTVKTASKKSGPDDAAADAEKSRRRDEKRNKEQRRRNALNDGLDNLLDLVFTIDPQLKDQAEQRARASSSRGRISTASSISSSAQYCLLSRVEILEHGISTLQRVHQENEGRKVAMAQMAQEIDSLKGESGGSQTTSEEATPASTLPSPTNPVAPFSNLNTIHQRHQFRPTPPISSNIPAASLGLGISLDLALQARKLATAASLFRSPPVPNNTLPALLPGDSTLYRALLLQKLQEENSASLEAAVAAALIGSPSLSTHSGAGAGSSHQSGPEASGHTNQDVLGRRERAPPEAPAASNLKPGDSEDGTGSRSSKRMRQMP